MFPNCKMCMFYNRERDELYRCEDDELKPNGSFPNNHFCIRFRDGIPKTIWYHLKKCPHYVKDFDLN